MDGKLGRDAQEILIRDEINVTLQDRHVAFCLVGEKCEETVDIYEGFLIFIIIFLR